jgi:hypothetical protein
MNYYIEKHDMNMILDALELLHSTIKTQELFGLTKKWPYSESDVDGLFKVSTTLLWRINYGYG